MRRTTTTFRVRRPAAKRLPRDGFTLIETLLVIAVVGILVGLLLLVGRSIFSESKVRQTQQILTVLDSLMTEYQAEYDAIPPFDETAYLYEELDEFSRSSSGSAVRQGEVRPEVAVFIAAGRGLAAFDSMLASIPPEFLLPRYLADDPDETSLYEQAIDDGLVPYSGRPRDDDERLTIRDSWGMEILYVHPDHTEATIGEDADLDTWRGFGRTKSRRPYFVSAGPDRIYYGEDDLGDGDELVGMDDNIYSYQPESPEG